MYTIEKGLLHLQHRASVQRIFRCKKLICYEERDLLRTEEKQNCFEIAKRTPAGSGEEVFDEVQLLYHCTGQADETEP